MAQFWIWYLYSLQVFEVRSVNTKWDHTGPGGTQERVLVSCGNEKNFLSLGGLDLKLNYKQAHWGVEDVLLVCYKAMRSDFNERDWNIEK